MKITVAKGGCLAGATALCMSAVSLPGPGPPGPGPPSPGAHGLGLHGPGLPGLGAIDPRTEADQTGLPWSAVALLLIPGVARCTAVAVAPHWAVTAAHCINHRALGHAAPPSSIHLVFGYRSGDYTRLLVPTAIRLPAGADPAATEVRGTDVAFLHVAETLTDLLPPTDAGPGATVALGGYGQDRAERLAIDPHCTVLAQVPAADHAPVLQHGCSGTRGVSGGALAMEVAPGTWRLAGMAVAAQIGGAGGYAVPGGRLATLLAALPP